MVLPKMKILSITRPHVVPNQYDFFSSTSEHKWRPF